MEWDNLRVEKGVMELLRRHRLTMEQQAADGRRPHPSYDATGRISLSEAVADLLGRVQNHRNRAARSARNRRCKATESVVQRIHDAGSVSPASCEDGKGSGPGSSQVRNDDSPAVQPGSEPRP